MVKDVRVIIDSLMIHLAGGSKLGIGLTEADLRATVHVVSTDLKI
jgi:hypothetical protein